MKNKVYFVYLLSSSKNGTLYIGMTNNLLNRIKQHKDKIIKGFTEKYEVDKLVYYEMFENVNSAIMREKQLKGWNRSWKIKLIEKDNPGWKDLFFEMIG